MLPASCTSMVTVWSTFRRKFGILQAPIVIGDTEGRGALPLSRRELRSHGRRKLVLASVQHKNAVKLHAGSTLRLNGAFHVVGTENNIAKASTLEHFLVHFFVAGVVATLAADGIHDDFASSFAGCRVEAQGAALERERSVSGVKTAANHVAHGALRRIDN